ncbi:MAG: ion channel [Gammaproteobacteria bacterium]|nr:ion channel [Gammaproteobacteria bacterium]
MAVIFQILWGSVLLVGCISIHVGILVGAILVLRSIGARLKNSARSLRWALLIGTALAAIVSGHTIEVWILAITVLAVGALSGVGEAIYFALVTYTTLGYGDVTLAPEFRILGAFGSVTGLLAFGLSTAFLVGLFSSLLPQDLD